MREQKIRDRMDVLGDQIRLRKTQLSELRTMYDLARSRLVRVEKQLLVLEREYEQLQQGQLPLQPRLERIPPLDT